MPLKLERNDITKVKADIIVNTANPAPIYSSGCDTAIYKAAGEEKLLAARKSIGYLNPGEIAVTDAYKLKAKYIIHAVSMPYVDGKHQEKEILESCYKKSLLKAVELGCKSIAFPLMGTGSYGFPPKDALTLALNVINSFLLEHNIKVILVVFGDYIFNLSNSLFEQIDQWIDEQYVQKAEEIEYSRRGNNPNYVQVPVKKQFSIEDYEIHTDGLTFGLRLEELIKERKLKNSDVYGAIEMSKQTFSKILLGDNNPSKKSVLSLCIALQLDIDDTVDLLRRANYAFSPNDRRDDAIRVCIENNFYKIDEINNYLFDRNLEMLF